MADAGLLGTIFGATAALIGVFGAKVWDEWRQRQSLRGAIRAEVAAILKGAETRGHERLFREYVERWLATGEELPIVLWGFEQPSDDVAVFAANVGKIGMLGSDVSGDVVMF